MYLKRYRTLITFLLILLVASFFRLQYLNKPLQKDEPGSFYEASYNLIAKKTPIYFENCLDKVGSRYLNIHTPLYIISLSPFSYFFDLNVIVLRLFTVIFSLASILLIYFIGVEVKGKKLGLLSAFLLSINRLHVENSQLLDIDGSFLTFFILLNVLFFLKWNKSHKKRYFLFTVVSLTLAFLAKEATFLLLPPFLIFFYKEKEIGKFFKLTIPVSAIVIPLLFLFGIIFSTNFFTGILTQVDRYVIHKFVSNRLLRLYQFVGIVTWEFTVPLILLFIFSLFFTIKKRNKFFNLFVFIISSFIIFYSSFLSLTRYFVPIIPFICLLIANFILELKILNNRKSIIIIFLISFLSFISFYFLKIRTDHLFLNNIKTNFTLIMIPYILSLLPLIFYFSKSKKFAIVLLVGMLIGFNIFFSQESINPLVTPDWGKGILETKNYVEKHSIEGPIISMHDIAFYSGVDFYSIELPTTTVNFVRKLIDEGKIEYVIYRTNTILINPEVEDFVENNCEKLASTVSRNVETVKIFKC